jgi:hypothetical protein
MAQSLAQKSPALWPATATGSRQQRRTNDRIDLQAETVVGSFRLNADITCAAIGISSASVFARRRGSSGWGSSNSGRGSFSAGTGHKQQGEKNNS